MEFDTVDLTAFLTDDVWFLPDPAPATAEPANVDPLPTDVDAGPNWDKLLQCAQHPIPSSECCWRRALVDPFVDCQQQVASLGHFGIGFTEGFYPETVPGTFTATEVEYGRPFSVVDASLLDTAGSQGSEDGCVRDSSRNDAPCADERQIDLILGTPDPVEDFAEGFYMSELTAAATGKDALIAPTSSDDHTTHSEAVSSPDTARPQPTAAAACPTAIATEQCTMYQDTPEQEIVKRPLSRRPEESDDCTEPEAEVARSPKKYRRKRKLQKISKSAEFIKPEQDESDSDYTPDPRKKKQPRVISPPTTYKNAAAAAKKPRKLTGKQVWFAKPISPTPRSLSKTNKPTRARDTGQVAVANYAPTANTARFAASATRARFALAATTIRPQPGVPYGDTKDAQCTFYELQEEFERAKQAAAAAAATGGSRNMQQVVFADKAGDAMYAQYAKAAEVIIKLG